DRADPFLEFIGAEAGRGDAFPFESRCIPTRYDLAFVDNDKHGSTPESPPQGHMNPATRVRQTNSTSVNGLWIQIPFSESYVSHESGSCVSQVNQLLTN